LQESDEHARDRKMQHGPLAKGGAGCSKEGEDKNKTLVVFGWRKWWGTNTNRLQSVLRGLVLKDVFSKVVFLNQVEGDNFSDIMRNLEVVKFNTTSGKDGAKVKVELRRCTMIERGKNGEKKKVGVVKVYKNGESAGQVHFDSEDNHCVQLKLDGGKTQFFESQHDDDPRDSRDFEAHSQLVKDISNVLIENHLNCGSADLDWVSVRLKAMLLPNKAPPGQPQHPHFLCGDDKVTWEHVGGDPANVQDVEKLLKNLKDPYTDERRKPDVVVILSTQGLPEADEIPQSCQEKRMLVIMLQLRHLLNKIWQKEGNGVHVVVENSLDQTAELALGPPGGDDKDNPGVAADFLNSQAIQARALVQALANPDIHSCVSELWDEQENNPSIAIMTAGEILGLRDNGEEGYREKTLAFGVVQQLVASARKHGVGWKEKHFAICVGYIEEATECKMEEVVLAPSKESRRLYSARSRLVCFVRKEDPDADRRLSEDPEDLDENVYKKTLEKLGRPSMLNYLKAQKPNQDADLAEGRRQFARLSPPMPARGARLRSQPKSV